MAGSPIIELVAQLNTEASEKSIQAQLKSMSNSSDFKLDIKCQLDSKSVDSIRTQLNSLTKDITLDFSGLKAAKIDNIIDPKAIKDQASALITALDLKVPRGQISDVRKEIQQLITEYQKFASVGNQKGADDALKQLTDYASNFRKELSMVNEEAVKVQQAVKEIARQGKFSISEKDFETLAAELGSGGRPNNKAVMPLLTKAFGFGNVVKGQNSGATTWGKKVDELNTISGQNFAQDISGVIELVEYLNKTFDSGADFAKEYGDQIEAAFGGKLEEELNKLLGIVTSIKGETFDLFNGDFGEEVKINGGSAAEQIAELQRVLSGNLMSQADDVFNDLVLKLKELNDGATIWTNWVRTAEGTLTGFSVSVKDTTGELNKFNYSINQGVVVGDSITGSDKGVAKVQQDIVRLKKELANFEASHKSIESGLTQPLEEVRTALSNLENGAVSVETVQTALENLKAVAANIGTSLKSTGSSFNVFDNAVNKAQNFDNIVKSLKMDVEALGASSSKNTLSEQLGMVVDRLAEYKRVEKESGRGLEWSQRYSEISSLIQSITNGLKVAQKEDRAFNKEFDAELAKEEKAAELKQKQIDAARQLREQEQGDYWQGRFEETIKAQTAENQVLKDMKKYYEGLSKEAEKAEKAQKKSETASANLANRIKTLAARMNTYATANERAISSSQKMSNGKTFAEEWTRLSTEMAKGAELTDRELKDLTADFRVFSNEAKSAGLEGASAWGKFLESFKTMSSYITANMVLNFVKREIREMVDEVITIDTAMTELRKVTEATNKEFEEFAKSAANTGQELGSSISDVINATSTFSRAGYNLKDAEVLGRVATLYQNVGDGINIDEASESLISVLKAFNIEATKAELVLDRINEVSNSAAIESGGLGVALQRVASAMDSANNSLDETIALVTSSNEIVENPEMVANGWRTVALRIRGAKTELEDAGLDMDGMVESTAKLRDLIKGISGIDIMLDENTFKSTYQIIDELGKVWKDISDINQASLLEAIAGRFCLSA